MIYESKYQQKGIEKMIKMIRLLITVALLAVNVTAQSQDPTPVDITIDRGGVQLKGKFYLAEGEGGLPTIILLQGSPGNPVDVIGLGKRLSQSGINAMTFNYSGTHQSQGELSFTNCLADITAAYTFLKSPDKILAYKIDTASIFLAGHSFGGGMAMTYAIKHQEIPAVISIAGMDWGEFFEDYIKYPEMKKSVDSGIDSSVTTGILRFEPGCMPKEIGVPGLEKLDPDFYTKRNASSLADKDLLIICGWDDSLVKMERHMMPLYRALKKENAQKVQMTAIQDDHFFSKSRDKMAQVLSDWIRTAPERNKTKD
ncbi:MAG: alpha/beta fold hydrolase [Bacteroidales bacterium]|nr:alpha/beta fold hydrolase [Bacteroidales bacterium]